MKRFIILIFQVMMASTIHAQSVQSVINVEDISRPNDVYFNSKDSALVVVRSHKTIELVFSLIENGKSSKPQPHKPFRFEIDASDDGVYYFAFPTGNKNGVQTLIISTRDGASVPVGIADLTPKQVKTFRVKRPFGFIFESYTQHRERALVEKNKGNYIGALEELKLANECYDKDSIENENNIRIVNSLIKYRRDGDAAYDRRDYKEAYTHYFEIHIMNPSDSLTEKRYKECQNYFVYECNNLFSKAEQYYKEKDFVSAIDCYRDIINLASNLNDENKKNEYTSYATEWLGKARDDLYVYNLKKFNRSSYQNALTYEYRKDTWIGFSYNSYKKIGGFIQIDVSPMIFEELRSACRYGDEKFAEINLSFGWTRKLFKYAWIHFGPGFTYKIYHGTYKSDNYPEIGYGESSLLDTGSMGEDVSLPKNEIPEVYEEAWKKKNDAFAISPVVGLDLKFKVLVLRLTYQYRFATKAKLEDFIGRHRISIGVGMAF